MNMRFVFGAAALFAFAFPVWASDAIAPELVSESDGSGLTVSSKPSGADLYVNNVLRGKTPLELTDLIPGTHALRLEKDGYAERKAVVTIPTRRRLNVYLEMAEAAGAIEIEAAAKIGGGTARLEKASVYVDGESAALGTVKVKEGFHSVRVIAFGYEGQTRTVYVENGKTEKAVFVLEEADFRMTGLKMSRKRFNPRTPGLLGSSTVSFSVSAAGRADLSIRDSGGIVVFAAALPPFAAWEQTVRWTGRAADGTPLADGTYEVIVDAFPASGGPMSARTSVEIDSRIDASPASASGGIGGFLFAPSARSLPASSFQIDAVVLAGFPYGAGAAFQAPPFAFAVRAAPLDDLTEAAAAFAVDVSQTSSAPTSIALSLKRVLLNEAPGRPFALAAAVRWAYSETSASPFASPSGAEVYLPLEFFASLPGGPKLSFALVPSALWAGLKGKPESALPVPAFGAGMGVRSSAFQAALSARAESRIEGGSLVLGPVLCGGELRFFPSPSIVHFSLLGGAWFSGNAGGGFGGAGIGLMY